MAFTTSYHIYGSDYHSLYSIELNKAHLTLAWPRHLALCSQVPCPLAPHGAPLPAINAQTYACHFKSARRLWNYYYYVAVIATQFMNESTLEWPYSSRCMPGTYILQLGVAPVPWGQRTQKLMSHRWAIFVVEGHHCCLCPRALGCMSPISV